VDDLSLTVRQSVARLVRIAATPEQECTIDITIADSFSVAYVLYMFSCGKGDSAMAVLIRPIPDSVRLSVPGDIDTVLVVPYEDDDRFMVALSEGTLLLGSYNEKLECRWDVAREGAGIVHFTSEGVRVDWRVEWAAASVYDPNVAEPPIPDALPLFPTLDRWAA
jgi:hypothetical protein